MCVCGCVGVRVCCNGQSVRCMFLCELDSRLSEDGVCNERKDGMKV